LSPRSGWTRSSRNVRVANHSQGIRPSSSTQPSLSSCLGNRDRRSHGPGEAFLLGLANHGALPPSAPHYNATARCFAGCARPSSRRLAPSTAGIELLRYGCGYQRDRPKTLEPLEANRELVITSFELSQSPKYAPPMSPESSPNEFRLELERFCRDALVPIIADTNGGQRMPGTNFEIVIHDGPNTSQSSYERRPLWSALSHTPGIVNLPAHATAVSAMQNDPAIAAQFNRSVGTATTHQRSHDAAQVLNEFLSLYLDHAKSLDFDQSAFAKTLSQFDRFWRSSTIRLRAVAPLYGFWTDVGLIPLSPQASIRELSPDELNRLNSRLSAFESLYRPTDFVTPKFCLSMVWDVPKIVEGSPSPVEETDASPADAADLFALALDALRLFKAGSVGYASVEVFKHDWNIHDEAHYSTPESHVTSSGDGYSLIGSEVAAFIEFWNHFRTRAIRRNPRIALALRRFGYGYERTRREDRLMDHVIAIEALLDDQDQHELSYRLSLRVAALLATNAVDRKTIFNRIRFAYDVRSAIAHGKSADNVPRTKIGDMSLVDF
jgi:hypothetical protein